MVLQQELGTILSTVVYLVSPIVIVNLILFVISFEHISLKHICFSRYPFLEPRLTSTYHSNTVTPQQVGHLANKYLFIFEKIRFASQKLNFSIFVFSKKIGKNDLKQLRSNKMLQKLIYSILVFLSSIFSNFYVFYFQNCFWMNMLWYYGMWISFHGVSL